MTTPAIPDADELSAQMAGVRALVRRLVRDGSVAEDVVQDAWIAAQSAPPPDDAAPRGWLAGIARNLARRRARAEQRRARHERAALRIDVAEPTVDLVARAEVHRRVVGIVLGLEEPYRTTLLARFFDGLGAAEIARRAGVPSATVRSRVKRGLDLVRERLDVEEEGDRRSWAVAMLPLVARPRTAAVLPLAGALAMKMTTKAVLAGAFLLVLAGGFAVTRISRDSGSTLASPPSTPLASAPRTAAPRTTSPATASLHGRVRRIDDLGSVAEATLTVRVADIDLAAIADARGAFHVDGVPAGRAVTVVVRADGFLETTLRSTAPASGEDLDLGTIWLEVDGALTVLVRTRADEPLPGVRVAVTPASGESGDPRWSGLESTSAASAPFAEGTTDAQGRTTFSGLRTSMRLRVTASKDGFAELTRPCAVTSATRAMEPLVLRLGEGHVLAGRVLDPRGEAIGGALVSAAADGQTERRARTGEDGSYRIEGLGRGEHTVRCARTGGAPVALRQGKLRVPEVTRLDLVLPDPALLTGRVFDVDTGSPLAGAVVRIGGGCGSARGVADGDGRYLVDALPEGVVQQVDVEIAGYVLALESDPDPALLGFALRGGVTTRRDFAMRRGASLAGSVTCSEGAVPGATVWAVSRRGHVRRRAVTDGEGRYGFSAIESGRVRVYAEKTGFSAETAPTDPEAALVTVPQTGTLRCDLRLVANAAAVVGRVIDAAGAPVPDAQVGYGRSIVTTAANGTFRCDGLVAAPDAWLVCTCDGFVPWQRAIDTSGGSADPIVIRLERSRSLRIRGAIAVATGEVLRDADVDVTVIGPKTPNAPPQVAASTGVPVRADETFDAAIAWSGGGIVRVTARAADGLEATSADIPLVDGRDEYRIDLELVYGVTLEGRVVDATSGVGIAAASIVDSGGNLTATADEDGRFVVRGVRPVAGGHGAPAGSCTVMAFAAGHVPGAWTIVEPAARADVRLDLAPALAIEGVVRFSDGAPVVGVGVAADRGYASYWPGPRDQGVTDSDGRFRVPELAAGPHRLHVSALPAIPVEFRPFVSEPLDAGRTDAVLVVERGAVIAGRVTTADGRPLAGVIVTATAVRGAETGANARTDADGRFRLAGLEDGAFDLLAEKQSYPNSVELQPARRAAVPTGTTDVEFVLRP